MQSWASFTHGVKYAIRIPANQSLEQDIAELLTRRLLGALTQRIAALSALAG
jgi:hypothetical protein